jgi:hypothetical protein
MGAVTAPTDRKGRLNGGNALRARGKEHLGDGQNHRLLIGGDLLSWTAIYGCVGERTGPRGPRLKVEQQKAREDSKSSVT